MAAVQYAQERKYVDKLMSQAGTCVVAGAEPLAARRVGGPAGREPGGRR